MTSRLTAGRVSLAWVAAAGLVAAATAPESARVGCVVAACVAVLVVTQVVPTAVRGPLATLTIIGVVGAEIQIGLGTSPLRIAALGLGFLLVMLVTSSTWARVPARWTWPSWAAPAAGMVLLGCAFAVRYAGPMIGGAGSNLQNGRIIAGGGSVQIGELTKILVVVGFGLLLPAGRSSRLTALRRAVAWAAAAAYVGPLLILDQGPGLLLAASLLVLSGQIRPREGRLPQRRMGILLTAAGVAVAVSLVPSARAKVTARVSAMLDPDPASQIGYAVNSLRQGGLIGRGVGTSQYTSSISQRKTDLLPAVLGSDLGLLALGVTVVMLIGALTQLTLVTARAGGRRADIAATLALMALLQAIWSCLAAIAWAPLTGVSAPFLVVTGSAVLFSAVVAGMSAGAVGRGLHAVAPSPALTGVKRVGRLSQLIVCVAAVGFVATSIPPTGAARIGLPRGIVWSADGAKLASYDVDGRRTYSATTTLAAIGQVDTTTRTASGLELREGRDLTCGGGHSWTERLETVVRPLPCRPADLVTTFDSQVQVAPTRALKGIEGSVVVLDSRTGAVLAQASTFERHDEMGPPGSTAKIIWDAAARHFDLDTGPAPRTTLHMGDETLRNIDGMTCPSSTLTDALRASCNSVFGWVATQLGQQRLRSFGRTYFGLDESIAYDGARYRDRDLYLRTGLSDGPMAPAQLARTAIGQESFRATPLGLAAMVSVVLNGREGRQAPSPHVVAGTCSGDTWHPREHRAVIGRKPLPSGVADDVYDDMLAVASGATLSKIDPGDWTLAGKTGTSDSPTPDGYDTRSYVVLTLSSRLVIVAEKYIDGVNRSNEAYPIAQQVIDALPNSERALPEAGCQ